MNWTDDACLNLDLRGKNSKSTFRWVVGGSHFYEDNTGVYRIQLKGLYAPLRLPLKRGSVGAASRRKVSAFALALETDDFEYSPEKKLPHNKRGRVIDENDDFSPNKRTRTNFPSGLGSTLKPTRLLHDDDEDDLLGGDDVVDLDGNRRKQNGSSSSSGRM